jgi:hypothetical protein
MLCDSTIVNETNSMCDITPIPMYDSSEQYMLNNTNIDTNFKAYNDIFSFIAFITIYTCVFMPLYELYKFSYQFIDKQLHDQDYDSYLFVERMNHFDCKIAKINNHIKNIYRINDVSTSMEQNIVNSIYEMRNVIDNIEEKLDVFQKNQIKYNNELEGYINQCILKCLYDLEVIRRPNESYNDDSIKSEWSSYKIKNNILI